MVTTLFVRFLVLVVSIAVLVLVLDRSLRYRISPLDQPSQHRNDPFQVGLANPIQFRIDRLERNQYIVNCSAFQSRTTRNLEKPILVFQALLAVAFVRLSLNPAVLSYQVREHLASGALVTVLDDYEPPPLQLNLVHREGRYASSKARAFLDLAIERLRAEPALAG